MKNLLGFLFVCILFTLSSCGSDSDDCTTDSFVGNFSGTVECDGQSASGILTITKISDTKILVDDNDGGTFEMDVVICTATYSESLAGFGSVDVTLELDGDKLTYKNESSVIGLTINCGGELERD